MLMAFDIHPLGEGFLREKNIMVRGLGHPDLFTGKLEDSSNEFSYADWIRVMGVVAGTARKFFKLLSTKSHVVLHPGGARESLHNKVSLFKREDVKKRIAAETLIISCPFTPPYPSYG
ncbi:hypothetical protein SADUNF_Sadunf13G0028000 [Salix dunnii]|uniref:Uncharacterized protein n=1 Tax=Salix dunnii TaxID=1413687 RepID=A0A835JGY8_9ROSI|nr:hypothetical protein SADUNF_Sadunf13G0028000 [Salix dunnii]